MKKNYFCTTMGKLYNKYTFKEYPPTEILDTSYYTKSRKSLSFQYRDKDQPPTEVAYRNVLTSTHLSKEKIEFVEKYVRNVLNEKNTLLYYLDFIKFHSSTKIFNHFARSRIGSN